jgi:hypothetical protein
MMNKTKLVAKVAAIAIYTICNAWYATAKEKKVRNRAIYASWGYNKAWYTKSTLGVQQPELGNDYKMNKVTAHDNPGWTYNIFRQPLTIPQYNYRLGIYFNKKQDLAFEINFDHVKYIIGDNQTMNVTGTYANAPIDRNIFFSRTNGFYYFLNNGANFLCFNLVKRKEIYSVPSRNLYIDLMGKAGMGPVIPHVENSMFGKPNTPQFQLGGWNAGIETAMRVTFMKYAYIEFAQKVDYARYSNLKVYEGRARHAFGTYELVLSLGTILPATKNNPLFVRETPATAETNSK